MTIFYLPTTCNDKGICNFLKGICSLSNILSSVESNYLLWTLLPSPHRFWALRVDRFKPMWAQSVLLLISSILSCLLFPYLVVFQGISWILSLNSAMFLFSSSNLEIHSLPQEIFCFWLVITYFLCWWVYKWWIVETYRAMLLNVTYTATLPRFLWHSLW